MKEGGGGVSDGGIVGETERELGGRGRYWG